MLQITQGIFHISASRRLTLDNFTLEAGESWAFVGTNGSGKSSLARALAGELPLVSGERQTSGASLALLSFEHLQKLVNDEWQRNNTDLLGPDEDDAGRSVAQIIQLDISNDARCQSLARTLGIAHLLERRFMHLSTGETRKALLCQALMSDPQLLILDEPFDGLDVASRAQLTQVLAQLSQSGLTLVLIINRFDDIPEFISQVGVLADCQLATYGERQQVLEQALIAQLAHSEHLAGVALPPPDVALNVEVQNSATPPIILRDGVVSYDGQPVLHHLTWQVNRGEHWQIVGPNGAGKSTLLNLITGDHPQGYSNDLTLFGRRRGSGETIWDIKQHIGYVSSSLHLSYRVSTSLRNVILSGYLDSIGIYQAVSDRQHQLTARWLALLGIDQATADAPFRSLSWGQQRLALIVRALVKHPTLLILDEPLQGLDPLNRQLVRRFIDILIAEGSTQLLFVSHHAQDAPDCITHRLTFVPDGEIYRYHQQQLN